MGASIPAAVILVLATLGSVLIFGPGLLAGLIAHQKGFRPWHWLVSAGPVGLVIVLFMPSRGDAKTPEQQADWENRYDWIGGLLSGITAILLFGFSLFLIFTLLSVPSVAVPLPAPRPIPVPPPSPATAQEGDRTEEIPSESSSSRREIETNSVPQPRDAVIPEE